MKADGAICSGLSHKRKQNQAYIEVAHFILIKELSASYNGLIK
jgi:hypothetical protein